MPRKAPLVFALLLVLTAIGVALYAAATAPTSESVAAGAAPATIEPAPSRPTAGSRADGPGVDVALKQLELMKPARARLAEDFTLPTPAGDTFRLSEQRGKVVLVNFWATWCPPCLEEMPAMERLYRQHRDGGFTLVAVSVDADSKVVAPFVTAHKFSFPVALDPSMNMANTYGVRALPSSFIVARDGTLAALAIGPRHWDNDAAHSLIEGLAR